MSQAHGYPDASFQSSEDMTSSQFYPVLAHTVRGQVALSNAGANAKVLGFVQNAPDTGEPAVVRCGGFTIAPIGEASLSTMDLLTVEGTDGTLEQVDAAAEWCCGILIDDEGTVADGDLREIFIVHLIPHASDA